MRLSFYFRQRRPAQSAATHLMMARIAYAAGGLFELGRYGFRAMKVIGRPHRRQLDFSAQRAAARV